MSKLPLQCSRMAAVAGEYCALIDNGISHFATNDVGWLSQLGKILPRLHVAVAALYTPSSDGHIYRFYDDEKRCEMFLMLNAMLQCDSSLWSAYKDSSVDLYRQRLLCERMADNLADMYFDLKRGLELLQNDPVAAAENWQHSFYVHWGKHLLDAECWLRAVECGSEPAYLPEWRWPNMQDMMVFAD